MSITPAPAPEKRSDNLSGMLEREARSAEGDGTAACRPDSDNGRPTDQIRIEPGGACGTASTRMRDEHAATD
jgi:hypothetical protein